MSNAPLNDGAGRRGRSRLGWLVALCCLVLLFAALYRPHRPVEPPAPAPATSGSPSAAALDAGTRDRLFPRTTARASSSEPQLSAEQVVSNKLAQFAQHRRGILNAMARERKIEVPDAVKRFFDAAESGDWDRIDAEFHALRKLRETLEGDAGTALASLFGPVNDTYGAAEQAHKWPAQKLLDYGNTVLGSLRPGMIYFGGTDEGRWIPELINDTSEGERHVIVTQNALADGSYLSYIAALYGDRLKTPTSEDSQKVFQDYIADAQRRLQHDTSLPNEPKQLLPGEDIRVIENRLQVSGQVAVMAINQKLAELLMAKNPGESFALQESYPLRNTYAGAAPLGPIMELGVKDVPGTFTADRAAQTVDYWRTMAQQVTTDPELSASADAVKSYSKLAAGQANLLANHDFFADAEQAYRLSMQMWPGNFESVSGLADVLARTGRAADARSLLDDFARQYPQQKSDVDKTREFLRTQPAR